MDGDQQRGHPAARRKQKQSFPENITTYHFKLLQLLKWLHDRHMTRTLHLTHAAVGVVSPARHDVAIFNTCGGLLSCATG